METVEIEVGIGKAAEKVQVLYSPRELVRQPFHVSHEAVQVMEMRWMQANLATKVREEASRLYLSSLGAFKTLGDYVSSLDDLRIDIVSLVDGVAYWEMELICDECDGDGETRTIRGTEITCPSCDGSGYTTSFSFKTDTFGRFIGYDEVACRSGGALGWMTFQAFDPLPIEDALAVTEREWS